MSGFAIKTKRQHAIEHEPSKKHALHIKDEYLKETQIINAWWPDTLRTTYYVCRPQRRAPPKREDTTPRTPLHQARLPPSIQIGSLRGYKLSAITN